MILDSLTNAHRYHCLNSSFAKAFDFLYRADLHQLKTGRHDLDGDKIFAIIAREPGRKVHAARLENHRNYIDIQYVISGHESMGWKSLENCKQPDGDFDKQRDLGFFLDEIDSLPLVKPGCFAIFFPQDAHMPLISADDFIHKVIIKIAIE